MRETSGLAKHFNEACAAGLKRMRNKLPSSVPQARLFIPKPAATCPECGLPIDTNLHQMLCEKEALK